jgi:hypothetical protein
MTPEAVKDASKLLNELLKIDEFSTYLTNKVVAKVFIANSKYAEDDLHVMLTVVEAKQLLHAKRLKVCAALHKLGVNIDNYFHQQS